MPTARRTPIDEETAGFLLSGLSISVASCDEERRPSLCRACGIRIADDRCTLRIVLVAAQAQRLLIDIERCGRAAAVFSDVDSHRTLQVKSFAASVATADDADREAAREYLRRFAAQLDRIGFAPPYTQALLGSHAAELVVVIMEPAELYSQTPGPQAGTRLRA